MIHTGPSSSDYLRGFIIMMGHTHALVGSALALGVAIATHTAPNTTLLLLAAGGLAALLPDVDHPRAPIRRKLGCIGALIFGGLKHRGITHTLLALVAVTSAALVSLPSLVGIVITIGYLSHILGDLLTVSGLPIFWPYKKESYHLLPKRLRLTTNTWPEHLISLALLVAIGSQLPNFLPRF